MDYITPESIYISSVIMGAYLACLAVIMQGIRKKERHFQEEQNNRLEKIADSEPPRITHFTNQRYEEIFRN